MGDAAEDAFDRAMEAQTDLYFCRQQYEDMDDKDLIQELEGVLLYEHYQVDSFTDMMKGILKRFQEAPLLSEKQRNAVITHLCFH